MAIKQSTDLSAYLASGRTITRVEAHAADATPLRILRARAEAHADATGEYRVPRVETYDAAEHDAERTREVYGAARAGGMSVSDALDEARTAYRRR